MNERMIEDSYESPEKFLTQRFLVAEYLDMENGNYVKTKYRRIEQYAFFLKFTGEWFYPCVEDQQKLKELITNHEIRLLPDNAHVGFSQTVNKKGNKMIYSFVLPFINQLPFYEFQPCTECQKEIAMILKNVESITIGNKDYAYPVEFNKRYADDDNFLTVEDRPPTEDERKRIGECWVRKELTEEEWQKLPVKEE
jgi:hypothetical protein